MSAQFQTGAFAHAEISTAETPTGHARTPLGSRLRAVSNRLTDDVGNGVFGPYGCKARIVALDHAFQLWEIADGIDAQFEDMRRLSRREKELQIRLFLAPRRRPWRRCLAAMVRTRLRAIGRLFRLSRAS